RAQLLPAARVTLSENRSRGFLVSSGFGGFPRSVCFVGNRLPSDLSLVVTWRRFHKPTRFVDGGHPAGGRARAPFSPHEPCSKRRRMPDSSRCKTLASKMSPKAVL